MILLELSDFDLGKYGLAQSINTKPDIQDYIDRYEEIYIKKILGAELGGLFITDIKGEDSDSANIEPRFQAILDPFIEQVDNDGDVIYESKGIKDALTAFVYYHYVFDTQPRHAQAGVIVNQAETSNVLSPENAARMGEQKFNEALLTVIAIQWLCEVHEKQDYPEYKGIYIRPQFSALL